MDGEDGGANVPIYTFRCGKREWGWWGRGKEGERRGGTAGEQVKSSKY